MLRIRFSRTGKKSQPTFRIVVANRSSSVKNRFLEILGHYMPARKPKIISINKDRVSYWISKGAIPTDSVASLLRKENMAGVEKYMKPRDKKRKKKGEKAAAKPDKQKPAEQKPEEKK